MSSYFERSKSLRKSLEAVAFSFFMDMTRMVTKAIFGCRLLIGLWGLFSMRIIGKNGIMFLYFLEEKAGYEITLYRYSPFFDQGFSG